MTYPHPEINRRDCLMTMLAASVAMPCATTWAEPSGTDDIPQLENLLNVTIHAPDDQHDYSHDPALEWYRGRFYAAWQGGPENREGGRGQSIQHAASADFKQWTAPTSLIEPASDQTLFAAVLWNHDDRLHLFYLENQNDPNKKHDAYILTGSLCLMTFDGRAWSDSRVILPPQKVGNRAVASSTTSKPIVLDSGRIVLPVQYLDDKHRVGEVGALLSDDNGKSWRMSERVPSDQRKLMEPTVVQAPDGRLVMYLRNHFDMPTVWRTISEDGGQTWSKAKPSEHRNWAKTHVRRLNDGRYIMMFNDNPKPPGGGPINKRRNLAIAISNDAMNFHTLGHIDTESNGFGISYPACVERNGVIYSIASRRSSPKTRRPNMVRGQVSRIIG